MARYSGGKQQQQTQPRPIDQPVRPGDPDSQIRGGDGSPRTAPNVPIGPVISEELRNKATEGYRGADFGYTPYQSSAGPNLQQMDFNPYQSAARNSAQSGAANSLVSQQAALTQTGGMSASDRIRAFSDFNRQKIMGQLGGAQKYDQAAGQNQLDVDRFNADRSMQVGQGNLSALNEAARDKAQANLRRNENLYAADTNERNLTRQLAASQKIAEAQMKAGGGASVLDKLVNPFNIKF